MKKKNKKTVDSRIETLKELLEITEFKFTILKDEDYDTVLCLGGDFGVLFTKELLKILDAQSLINKYLTHKYKRSLGVSNRNREFFNLVFNDLLNFIDNNIDEFPPKDYLISLNTDLNFLEVSESTNIKKDTQIYLGIDLNFTFYLNKYLN